MTKKLFVVLLSVVFLSVGTSAHAAADGLLEGMMHRLLRGVVDTFTGWVELPAQIVKGYNEGFMGDEDNKIVGTVVGIFDGLGHGAGRTLSGIADMAFFWAANPEDNVGVGIPLDADYAWEEGTPYDITDPDLMDGAVMPIGGKLFRGLGNSLLGVVEVPGQIMKGVSEGAPDLGIIKGIWYFLSREAAGVTDLVTFYLPGPEENVGMAFDENWPWEAVTDTIQ